MSVAHQWVEMQIIPVEVEVMGDDTLITHCAEGAEIQAAADSLDFCWNCHTALTLSAINTECPGNVAAKEV